MLTKAEREDLREPDSYPIRALLDHADEADKVIAQLREENIKLRRMYCDGAESCSSCELVRNCDLE